MVTMLNEFNPTSDDLEASSLMKALTDLLPAMFGDELGFLVRLGGLSLHLPAFISG